MPFDTFSYWLGKHQGGGGGGAETYPLTISNEYCSFVLVDGDAGAFVDKEPGNNFDYSDIRVTAAKGDTLYLLAYWEPMDSVSLTFIDQTRQQDPVTLLEIIPGDFTTATIEEDTVYYTEIDIPETDIDGEPWGGEGFINAFIPSGNDDPVQ